MASPNFSRYGWALAPITGALGFAVLGLSGVAWTQALVITFIVAIQVAAGSILWSLIRGGKSNHLEKLGMGLALGPVISLATGLAVQLFGRGTWGWLIAPLLVFTLGLYLRLRRRKTNTAGSPAVLKFDLASLWAFILTIVLGSASLLPNIASYPLNIIGIANKYHADIFFFEALSTSISKFGPFNSIFTPGSEIRYHWLVYAWSGQVTAAADASPFVVLTRVVPLIAILASCFIAIVWVRRLTKVVWAPSLAVLLLITGGYVGATYGVVFNFDSPSLAMTAAWILAFGFALVILLDLLAQSRSQRIALLIMIAILSAALAGGKISSGIEALAAVFFTTAVGLVLRKEWGKRAALAAGSSFIGFLLSYVIFVAGSADPGQLHFGEFWNRASSVQGLNPIPGNLGIALGTAILLLAMSFRWAGLIWLFGQRQTRTDPSVIFGFGLAITGVLAILILSSGLNETWFALAASAPLAAISAAGVAEMTRSILPVANRTTKLTIAICVLAAFALFVLVSRLWATGPSGGNDWVPTLRWLGPIAALVGAVVVALVLAVFLRHHTRKLRVWFGLILLICVFIAVPSRLLGVGMGSVADQPGLRDDAFGPIVPFVVTRDQNEVQEWSTDHSEAASWLRTNAGDADVLATNITFGSFIPAITRMQTLASAVNYQAMYGPANMIQPLVSREGQSWDFIDSPNKLTVQPLCDANVKWVWVDPMRSQRRDWLPFATIVFENPSVTILKINQSTCT
ncbi:MAG: hypothetical protein F2806_06530 [Actinobacteria bacterium]|uniref:Unannotated protein n=1 Tax=freshwater metagenome TaxID=449393 RepID=A0A6J7GPE0_9ZZZZ|nr:hypothetical protein [Actinomycetota bacterium]